MSIGRGTHDVVGEPGEAKIESSTGKTTAIQLDTRYAVVSYTLTPMRSFSIVLPRESKFVSIQLFLLTLY